MRVTRRAGLMLSAATAMAATVVPGPGLSAVAEPAARPAASESRSFAPEADVSHHGRVALRDEHLGVMVRTENSGPSSLVDATVRLRFSVPLAARQQLPRDCLRSGDRAVLCATGALGAGGDARRTAFGLRLTGRPAEVVVRVDTVWNGGASDRDRRNDTHEVLALSTGDAYVF
ncbi:hypothetical protein [Streptomyces sp. B1I3]|uniref:hypothetical protein n=1 Tax=Streptomyces sp. B1I3 TaxID=3042264 RepID=UPI002785DBAF|nr:hypothetical protein [Streptomyces sp. B1I3]MDQ0795767.1 hypothetical protein [Streptomyces sp. B1I3]